MKKGISISTEVLVALAIAVIVLLALVSMLMGVVPGASSALGCDADFRVQCNRYVTAGGCKEGSSLGVFDGCNGGGTCPTCDESSDSGCSYIKCSVANCATGGCNDPESVKRACCGSSTPTP